ncbi:hypothetical protein PHLGIDRAFT_113305 [Phlebiopsis gigantea 11061_1 CR5-6]|uniref:Uncharacterized protein n=1 Tax=Phlebiopsis gigantea (strain 11061_1 CR5-6) TaxID=745531 RepID=A0A0C3SEF8_PHLG1|nr:hypothetical protein PHLGIDRAFT_113305 [Phlebiopsis gigantea 11061_1 CR5-6]
MHPLTMRTTIPPSPDEVVEDSEPEREQRRLAERAKRKTKRTAHAGALEKRIVSISSDSDAANPKAASPVAQRQPDEVVHHTVIEISDDEPAYDWDNLDILPPRDIPSNLNDDVPNLTTLSDSLEDTTRLPSVREIVGLPRRTQSTGPSSDVAELPLPTGTEVVGTRPPSRENSPSPRRSSSRTLDIARFAYAGSQRTISSRAPSRTPSLAPFRATPAVDLPKGPKPSRATSNTLSSLSDSDAGKLRRCVCCELAWTTRKTAPQKRKHIQSCARKLHISPDTLQHLLRAELERIKRLPPEESGKKGKGKLPEVPLPVEPGTLLEDALGGKAKKKSGPRRKVVESVKELHETRQDILDRAKQLLGGATKPIGRAIERGEVLAHSPQRTQPFGQSRLAQRYVPTTVLDQTQMPMHVPDLELAGPSRHPLEEGEEAPQSPPRTQPFGESALARKFGKARARESGVHDEHWTLDDTRREHQKSPLQSPPRTQTFGESTLAKRFGETREAQPTSLLDAEDPDSPVRSPQTTVRHIFNELSNSSPARHAAAFSSDDSEIELADAPPPDFAPARNSIFSFPLDPHSSNALGPFSQSLQNSSPESATPSRSESSADALDEQHHDDGAVIHYEPAGDIPATSAAENDSPPRRRRSASPAAQAKRTKAKPRSKKDAEGAKDGAKLTDEELHEQLRARIEQDTALYHRVLRYEPVHFDVFLALAGSLNVPERGLKLRVRDFLDKQAIHFSGLDATKDRTKRRRG